MGMEENMNALNLVNIKPNNSTNKNQEEWRIAMKGNMIVAISSLSL